MRCEGWRRYGGAFTLGPVTWKQCKNEAIVILEVVQDGKIESLPGCATCWQEAIDNGIQINSSRPTKRASDGLESPAKKQSSTAGSKSPAKKRKVTSRA
jgi:hypothetical protein